jgi:hypothetical protein
MSTFEPRAHVFVDESKSKGYFVAAAAVSPLEVTQVDRELRKLTRRGQSRIHFSSESDPSRKALLDQMKNLRVAVQLYVVRGHSDKDARRLCLEALVADVSESRAARLTLERDDSLVSADRRIIRAALVKHDYVNDLVYQHVAPSEHSVLWVSDAIAWCQQAGGHWIARARPLVQGITRLD